VARLQLLHSTPPWPDANRPAHETIHEQTRQGSTGRDRETAKLLLRHTTADSRLRGRKGSQRFEGLVSGLPRTPSGLANDAVVAVDGPHPPDELGAVDREVRASSSSPAVAPACHKERSRAVCSGQSRSTGGGRSTGRTSLTWDGGGGRNCMACKGSGVQIPSAAPRSEPSSGPLRRQTRLTHPGQQRRDQRARSGLLG
jgi:hypothetical protein